MNKALLLFATTFFANVIGSDGQKPTVRSASSPQLTSVVTTAIPAVVASFNLNGKATPKTNALQSHIPRQIWTGLQARSANYRTPPMGIHPITLVQVQPAPTSGQANDDQQSSRLKHYRNGSGSGLDSIPETPEPAPTTIKIPTKADKSPIISEDQQRDGLALARVLRHSQKASDPASGQEVSRASANASTTTQAVIVASTQVRPAQTSCDCCVVS